ncbi:LCP family protein required for cell wall assembly [Aeromicrobium panaciterrae]|uniref:LCP family protein required for cell wall assembly n=1 Tax=Aeromicrobium panaciterrae TaxID=363861 RepID=A0ABU1UL93_9ACTN|nr:LCP family protein [Aeromicrobium panaciterrae]MDR7085942.1 LCP family protein required for cell wall assembly [Aeromicrobium panaciterrae]
MGEHTAGADEAVDGAEDSRGFFRRHSWLTAFLALITVLALAVGVFAYMLNHSLTNIERVPVTLNESVRPAPDDSEALNILLLGADAGSERNPGGNSILEDAASGKWPTGKYRSDATMLVHISADRKTTYIASIPRDSYVPVFDDTGRQRENTKINAALSLYGPSGAISTVENLTGLRIDHLAMVDWDGFEDITNALGGVKITTASEGTRELNGKEALNYVRERYSVPGGDFGRVKRQQNFLRSMMIAILDRGTLTNPLKLRSTLSAITNNIAVDEDWSNSSIRSLAISMRSTRANDVTFMTIPTNGTGTDPVAGSIVNVDYELSDQLFQAMRDDTVGAFVDSNPDLLLGSPTEVD